MEAQVVKSPVSHEVWVMAWGKTYGDTGSRLYARLFAFDATASMTRVVWRRDGLVGGELRMEGARIRLSYYAAYPHRGEPQEEWLDIRADGVY
jgi:hypothetical protein